ncbi:hypothetical protein SAMN05421507_13516 [Lentzea jiangxiensis]|uniref:Uncharacterized protein n=1 Tax=Lentzea jiangxiensis TaxID=641025 RepID=A0A1H0X4X2_9PSEU|nr:hypothetical protein SAMN05421507_13516 [Lentzea jiangxiensis]
MTASAAYRVQNPNSGKCLLIRGSANEAGSSSSAARPAWAKRRLVV